MGRALKGMGSRWVPIDPACAGPASSAAVFHAFGARSSQVDRRVKAACDLTGLCQVLTASPRRSILDAAMSVREVCTSLVVVLVLSLIVMG